MLFFSGIKARILLIPLIAVLALVAAGTAWVVNTGSSTLAERRARARVMVEGAISIVDAFANSAAKGEISEDEAKRSALAALRTIRFDGDNYIIARDTSGITLVSGPFTELEGKQSINSQDSVGDYYARNMIEQAKAGGGFNNYVWPHEPGQPPVAKTAYSLLSKQWNWVVSAGIYIDDVDRATRAHAWRTAGTVGTLALITLGLALVLGRTITGPLLHLSTVTRRLAEGQLDTQVPATGRHDEIGTLAQAIEVLRQRSAEAVGLRQQQEQMKADAERDRQEAMRRLADEFENSVKGVVDGIAAATGQMETSAHAASTAASEADGQTVAAAAAAEQTSANVETVAAATEELSASINEIARQVAQSTEIAAGAVSKVEHTNTSVADLAESARRVGDVVALIQDIAAQTNLLALNATIEAARAGEAGKGFAVVAGEVKSLASQTARATEEIQAKVAEIQGMTSTAVTAIASIGETVHQMDEITAAIAAAVEEQGAATAEIANSVQQAAIGTRQVSGNVAGAGRAVSQTGTVAETVLTAAQALTRESDRLRDQVHTFLTSIR